MMAYRVRDEGDLPAPVRAALESQGLTPSDHVSGVTEPLEHNETPRQGAWGFRRGFALAFWGVALVTLVQVVL
ncbi:MAG: hypothetical protein M0R73_02635 [Dehalococcoidia bacterium]|nr:hypothetical protein [Dehalococcoidia bacterium]